MKLTAALLASGLTFLAQGAGAQSPAPELDPWRYTIAPYAWAVGVTGSVTVRNQTVDTNASAIDLIQKSDSLAGLMAYFEADKGPAGFYLDFVFAKMGFGAGQLGYRNPIAGLQISTRANAALTYQLFIVEVGGVYELWRSSDSPQGSSTALDGIVGFRYWNNSIDATFTAAANVSFTNLNLERSFSIAVARSDVIQWVDPVLGLRLRHQLTPNQEVMVRGDIGGFGISGSQFAWQAVATYGYTWQYTGYDISALIGFRAIGVNYSQGSGANALAINEILYGPIIGVKFRF